MQNKFIFFMVLTLWLGLSSNFVLANETIRYEASYKGVLSLFRKFSIAEVTLSVDSMGQMAQSPVDHLKLSVSSEKYKMAENLYSFRYFYQSLYETDLERTLYFENIKKTKEIKHKVGLFDWPNKQVQLFKSIAKDFVSDASEIRNIQDAKSLNLTVKAKALTDLPDQAMDRLSLLQNMRKKLQQGKNNHEYLVTTADELMTYKFSFAKDEVITSAGKKINARKIKVEAFDVDQLDNNLTFIDDVEADEFMTGESLKPRYRHPPIYIWFSLDDKYLPIKFVNHHSLGQFVIQRI